MRALVESRLKNKELPLVIAHMGGSAHGRENSRATVCASLKYNPDMIEVDVRKSKDGVLCCHHGSAPFGVVIAPLLRLFSFSTIKRLVGGRDRLLDILCEVPRETFVFLDIKDRRITAKDCNKVFNKLPYKNNIWISAYTLHHLKRLRAGLGEDFIYVLNMPRAPLFWHVRSSKNVADVIKLFAWQVNKKNIAEIKQSGLRFHLSRFFSFASKQQRVRLQLTYGDVAINYEDVSRTHKNN